MKYKPGDRVGSMTLLEIVEVVSYGSNVWKVRCDCGAESNKKVSDFWKLKSCSYKCPLHPTRRLYPVGTDKEQHVWFDIKKRCLDSEHACYKSYGGRGITLHSEWVNDFAAFYAHIGPAPSKVHSVDRIDNNKGYEPGNVRWATFVEQQNNRRDTIMITAKGVTKPLAIWARELNVPQSKLYWRYTHGWNHEDIIAKN